MVLSVLADNSILSWGEFARTISVEVPGYANRLLFIEAKSARPAGQEWLRTQIEALPTIAYLARREKLQLYSYFELTVENWRGARFPSLQAGNVFEGIKIAEVNAPIIRSRFAQTDMNEFYGEESQRRFCEWLLDNGEELLKKSGILERLTTLEIDGLKSLGRYREICHSLSKKQYVDAWHLWTGELNGIANCLTTDAKLVNALSTNKRLSLRCRPIYPEDLLLEMGIADRQPLPYQYGRRYYLNGVPYD
jgi:hypothetical protein